MSNSNIKHSLLLQEQKGKYRSYNAVEIKSKLPPLPQNFTSPRSNSRVAHWMLSLCRIKYTKPLRFALAGGSARLDCYAQTGWRVVPTHYLVDADGRVQLITMASVNWVLSGMA